jgi:predicted CXXCH cytochrome family protein
VPRAAVTGSRGLGLPLALLLVAANGSGEVGPDPHFDPGVLTRGCLSCHLGHGVSRSPMLPAPQRDVCLSCHGTRADRDRAIRAGKVASSAEPRLLGSVFSQPYVHPISNHVFTADEPGAVTCTSCHSPHRGYRDPVAGTDPPGRPRRSSKNPSRLEYELCEGCHGSAGATTQSLSDISRLFHPGNQSYHPVEAPARDGSPSVITSLVGREINCTDCHGNADSRGPRGPHGSTEPFILRAPYTTLDGSSESRTTYALCYTCHRRQAVLNSSAFAGHGMHITEVRASCATCHSPHGSVGNRALIRFGEEAHMAVVSPSVTAGRLRFVSDGPGSGACFLTCHGRDHAPEGYGAMKLQLGPRAVPSIGGPLLSPRAGPGRE